MTEPNDFIPEAEVIAASCWLAEETRDLPAPPALVKEIASKIAVLLETAAQNQRNADYYRDLLIQCGEIIGGQVYVADNGTISEDVLCSKIPEILREKYNEGI